MSYYWWRKSEFGWGQGQADDSLEAFIHSDQLKVLARNALAYSVDGVQAVDKICRFENLEHDIADVAAHLSLGAPILLPRSKAATRGDRRPPSQLMSAADADLIASTFPFEVSVLGYSIR